MMTSCGSFSNGDRVEWFSRFEILCCQANDWMKGTQFLTLLEWKVNSIVV